MGISQVAVFVSMYLFCCLGDDSSVMNKLATSISPVPSNWKGSDFCVWSGVQCDGTARVTSISLASSGLSGVLPPELNELTQLETLSLQGNSLSGSIPSLSNLASLKDVYLDSNSFTDMSPGFLEGLTSLQTMSLNHNSKLPPWTITSVLTQSSSLVTFSASNASIVGSIPDIFGSLPNLQNLRLSYNNLTGHLPLSFSVAVIRYLWLNNQASGLSGRIDLLSNMTQLMQAWLHKNVFTGPIPDLSECKSLFDLQLRQNQLTGLVPPSLTSLPALLNVSLEDNLFQGPLPVPPKGVHLTTGKTGSFCRTDPGPCDPQVSTLLRVAEALGYPVTLARSWLGNSVCQGWAFVACNSQMNVVTVNFGKQRFTGTISPAFSDLTSLKYLYLNENNLTGPIPGVLTSMKELNTLDVSNNDLSGKIPTFPPTLKLITTGNLQLRSETPSGGSSSRSSGNGISSSSSSSSRDSNASSSSSSSSSSLSPVAVTGIAVAALILLSIFAFFLYGFYKKRRFSDDLVKNDGPVPVTTIANGGFSTDPNSSKSSSEMPFLEGGNYAVSIQVLRHATNGFSESNVLGRGGFGVVYKGELNDGTEVAVKRMISECLTTGSKGMSEFQAEIAVLTKVRHRHLVALLGFCTNGNERLLVYEYMPKGTLAQHLFEPRDQGFPPLTWKQRLSVALDVARGIEYLHSLARESFIHRDLKPSNILLGDDMRAKVADFGLVKNAPDGKFSMETRLAGTFGYLAPEYAATGRVTTKVDVYAFGVILMELITGRKALDGTMPDEKSYLVAWFRRLLVARDNGVQKAIDRHIHAGTDGSVVESVLKVAELAGHCTAREPFQRPEMGHAVNVLGPLVELWKPTVAADCDDEGGDRNGIIPPMSLPDALRRWQATEGTSSALFYTNNDDSQSSIPSRPPGFGNTFGSVDGR